MNKFSLSYAQQRLWFIDQLLPNSSLYNIPIAFRLTGNLDRAALESAFLSLIKRHEILRTIISPPGEAENVQQLILDDYSFLLQVKNFSLSTQGNVTEDSFLEYMQKEASAPFNLQTGPLMRAKLLRLGDEYQHILLITLHHIIADGWSLEILFRELGELYNSHKLNSLSTLPELEIQYADFSVWQREWLKEDVLINQMEYWRDQLSNVPDTILLPTDRPRPSELSYQGGTHHFTLSKEDYEKLKKLSENYNATLYMILLGIFKVFLFHHTGQNEIVVGSPVANRHYPGVENLIGFFVNMLALRTSCSNSINFIELLSNVKNVVLSAYENQDIPFEQIVDCLNIPRNINRHPLFQVAFIMQNSILEKPEFIDLVCEPFSNKVQISKFDLTLSAHIENESLKMSFEYSEDLFDSRTISCMSERFIILVKSILNNPEGLIKDFSILTPAERSQQIDEWNNNAVELPTTSIQELFEQQANRTPDDIAVVFENQDISYRMLDMKANQLAQYLRMKNVNTNIVVGIYIERSIEMVICMLGVLKAGGAYLPIDTVYPSDRVNYMLENARVNLVLTKTHLISNLNNSHTILNIDTDNFDQFDNVPLKNEHDMESLIYVLYTSGSTGRPKGAMLNHKGIVNLLNFYTKKFQFSSSDKALIFSSFSFDLTQKNILGVLLTGGQVHLSSSIKYDPFHIIKEIHEGGITLINCTPSGFYPLLEEVENINSLNTLRMVFLGGEAINISRLVLIIENDLSCQVVNTYGPTECSDLATTYCLTSEDILHQKVIPVGKAVDNVSLYIFGSDMDLIPIGVAGELYIGGMSLGKGYFGDKDLTDKKFVQNPFNPEEKIYRVGDIVRYRSDGNIEFLGRIDNQVKINGNRVELEEIEAVIDLHPAVQESILLVKDNGASQNLIAYIVPNKKTANPIWQRIRLVQENNSLKNSFYDLPNGMTIAHLNKHETDFIYQEIFDKNEYLKHGIVVKEGDCIFDIGANIGMFTLFINKNYKNINLYAFEPMPPTFNILKINTQLYDIGAKLFNCAISNVSRTQAFTYYPNVSIMSGKLADKHDEREVAKSFLLKQHDASYDSNVISDEQLNELLDERLNSEVFDCPVKTISEIIHDNNIEEINLLKIDVEKSELDVLMGIQEQDWAKIKQIVLEIHDTKDTLAIVCGLLEKQGFQLTTEQASVLEGTGLYNIYAIRHSSAIEIVISSQSDPCWESAKILIADVRQSIKSRCPEYMIPRDVIILEQFPLNANGKVDRKALAETHKMYNTNQVMQPPRNLVEFKLFEIWTDLLETQDFGIDDNFFELGGNSLLAVRLVSTIKRGLNKLISIKEVFSHSTIAQQAKLLKGSVKDLSNEPLLPINTHGMLTPLFLVHPASGLAFCYTALRHHLRELPIYGINNPYFGCSHGQFDSIEEMANHYVESIIEVQPNGPYKLAGWSLGGVVALEMAKQLKRKGKDIEIVVLLDSFNFSSYDSDLVKSTFSRREGVEKLLIKEGIDPLSEEAELLRIEASNNKRLLMKYVPEMYDGRVALLKADFFDDEDAGYHLNMSNGWKNIIQPGIEVYRIPARHEEFFDHDNLSLISERINFVLTKEVRVAS